MMPVGLPTGAGLEGCAWTAVVAIDAPSRATVRNARFIKQLLLHGETFPRRIGVFKCAHSKVQAICGFGTCHRHSVRGDVIRSVDGDVDLGTVLHRMRMPGAIPAAHQNRESSTERR